MLLQDGDIEFLIQIGFTVTQAKLYLALLKLGRTDAKTLSNYSKVPRQATYRTLGELQEKGICERIVAMPQEYEAIPLQDGLSLMINEKANEYAIMLQKAREFLLKVNVAKEKTAGEEEFKISFVEGKETLLKRHKILHDKVQTSVCCCSALQRWAQITQDIFPNVKNALDRGVKIRFVLEKPKGKINLPKEVKSILDHPNVQLRWTAEQLKLNAAIFDRKETFFCFYPAKSFSESPMMVWTNHPSLIISFLDHFENVWSTAQISVPQ